MHERHRERAADAAVALSAGSETMASVEECHDALCRLADLLSGVDADTRARVVPRRVVACVVSDLDASFVGRLDADGLHDLRRLDGADDDEDDADITVTLTGDELIALANGDDNFVQAWLRGRLSISAGVRDLLRLRALFGL